MADYTRLNQKDLESLLAFYDLGPLENARALEGGQANSSYKITTPKGEFTLSVCDEKTDKEIHCLTKVLTLLEIQGIASTRLIPARTGKGFIHFKDKPVYIKEFLPGQIISRLTCSMVKEIGQAMAEIHRITPPEYLPKAFPYGVSNFEKLVKKKISHPFIPWLKAYKQYIQTQLDPSMAKGFIHGDIFWDNLLFDRERLTAILDFEEACQYYFLFDLGMTAVGCCADSQGFDMDKVAWMLKGYQTTLPLGRKEKNQYKIFMIYAAVSAAFWRFRQYNIRYPDQEKKNNYKELAELADQIRTMDQKQFMQIF